MYILFNCFQGEQMKTSMKIFTAVCFFALIALLLPGGATAKISDNDEDSRTILLAGKYYRVYESNEIDGGIDLDDVDYVAIKTKYIATSFGDSMDDLESSNVADESDNSDDSDQEEDTENKEECENGVCYVDTVLDEDAEEKTLVKLDADEAIALFEANTKSDATSIDNTEYPYSIKSALDKAGVESEIWTVGTKEGRKIYLNVFELEDGKQVKAFTYNGKPREVTTLSEGSDIMAKRLLCKVCNIKKSFGKVVSISE